MVNHFLITPDWTIEIFSPDQNQTRVIKNILHCLQHGTQMGWLVDPDKQTVFVYLPGQPTAVYDHPEARLPVTDFAQELNLTLEGIFHWLME